MDLVTKRNNLVFCFLFFVLMSLVCFGSAAQRENGDNQKAPIAGKKGNVVITDIEEGEEDLPAQGEDYVYLQDRFPSGKDKVLAQIYKPKAEGRFPCVIMLHGSDPRLGEKHYIEMAVDLARNDYVCFFVKFYDRGRKSRGTRADWTNCIADAITYASGQDYVDGDKIALLGYSLGAFLALNYAPSDDRVKAVVAYYGGISPGYLPSAEEKMPPTLLLHGTFDRTVPYRRSTEAFQALRSKGKPVDVVIYKNVGHGFLLHTRGGWDEYAGEDAWNRTISFLNVHLKYPAWHPEVFLPLLKKNEETPVDPVPESLKADLPFLKTPYLDSLETENGQKVLIDPSADELKSIAPPKKSGQKKTPVKANK
jgi:dienelactone hydrolase